MSRTSLRWALVILAVAPAAALSGAPAERLLEDLGVRAWHDAGYRGQGVKVAVLDTGFGGYQEQLGKALPAHVRARSFRRDDNLEARDSRHGILCAEVVHAVAPGAELLLANWEPERPDQFLDAVHWAREQGARVLTCSLIMPTWSDGEGHGPVHTALAKLLGDGERTGAPLFFASAGNTAQRHWSGRFHDGGEGLHQWALDARGPVRDNPVRPWGSERVSVELYWQTGSYELTVRDVTSDRLVGRAFGAPVDGSVPHAVVAFVPQEAHEYTARVYQLKSGSGPFHLVVLGGNLGHSRARGSVPFPGDGSEVIAVGAVDGRGQRCEYSSCGPTADLVKPDLVATVPFPSSWRTQPFAGTSAAAPQAAALAALVWSRHPGWTARQVQDALRRAAIPTADSHLWETGHGRVHVP
jgi:subtilisin family serine protease